MAPQHTTSAIDTIVQHFLIGRVVRRRVSLWVVPMLNVRSFRLQVHNLQCGGAVDLFSRGYMVFVG